MMPGRGGRFTRNRGFTLFEMVIAVSIFALMGVVAFTGLSQMTRTGEAVADANRRLSDLQFAVVYFTRDWAQVSPRKIRDEYGSELSNIVLTDGAIGFTHEMDLRRFTQRLLCWRSELGNDHYWSTRLGTLVAQQGATNFWTELTARTDEFAQHIAGLAPLAVRAMKTILQQAASGNIDQKQAEQLSRRASESQDLQEGFAAKAEKRAPQFRGE